MAAPKPTPVERKWTIAATPEEAERVLRELMDTLEETLCPCGDADEVRLALREAINNAVKHGSRLDPNKPVNVACRCSPQEGLWVMIRDEGPGFDPDALPDPTAPENLERFSGRGVYMIRELMDEVEFRDGGRELHMRRRPRS
jgi:serine/threonine-protein kinase RsbW